MVDTVKPKGLPDMPAKVGAIMRKKEYSPIQVRYQDQGQVPVYSTWV
jgi:hypothetical protein